MDLSPYQLPGSHDSGYRPSISMISGNDTVVPDEGDDGWLLGFVDLLMLLLTLFVLLLAFTQLPRHADAHASSPAAIQNNKAGQNRQAVTPTPQPRAAATRENPTAPVISIPADIRDKVQVTTNASDVNLVIKDDVLFDAGSDNLKAAGQDVLASIAELLKQNDHTVSVEGHTDNIPIHTTRFPCYWELSAARATNVTRQLIQLGVDASRLRAIGFADTKPLDSNDTPQGRAHNRRVSLVIHLNDPDARQPPRDVTNPSTVISKPDYSAHG